METLYKLTVHELKNELSRRGRACKGIKKDVLVSRLKDVLESGGTTVADFLNEFNASKAADLAEVTRGLTSRSRDNLGFNTVAPEKDCAPDKPCKDAGINVYDSQEAAEAQGFDTRDDNHKRAASEVASSIVSIGSTSSRHSSCSRASVSSLRAREQARKAGLRARIDMLKEKQKLEEQVVAQAVATNMKRVQQ